MGDQATFDPTTVTPVVHPLQAQDSAAPKFDPTSLGQVVGTGASTAPIQAANRTATETDPNEKNWAGMGLALHEIPQGLRSLLSHGISASGTSAQDDLEQRMRGLPTVSESLAADAADREQNKEANATLRNTLGYHEGRALPYLVGGQGALPGKLATRVLPNVAFGTGMGQTDPNVEGNRGEAALNDAIGSAIFPGIQKVLGGIPSLTRAIDPAVQRATDTMRNWGVPIDAAQAAGSKKLDMLKRYLYDSPLGHPTMAASYDATKAATTKAALSTAGETAETAHPEAVASMMSRIGLGLDNIGARAGFKLTPELDAMLTRVEQEAPMRSTNPSAVLENIRYLRTQAAQNGGNTMLSVGIPGTKQGGAGIMGSAGGAGGIGVGGTIPGDALQRVRTALSGLRRDPQAGQLASDAHDTLMANFDKQVAGTPFAGEWDKLRQQYKNAKVIENSVEPNESGLLSPAKMTSQMGNRYNKPRMTRGHDDDMVDIVKAYNQLSDKYPNSGTGHRGGLQILGHYMLPSAIGAGVGAYEDKENPWTGAAIGSGAGLSAGVAAMLMDPLLAKGLTNQTFSRFMGGAPQIKFGEVPAGLSQAAGEELKHKYAKGGRAKVEKTMHEFKHGELHSGSKTGKLVTSRDQAIAIALSQQRKADAA